MKIHIKNLLLLLLLLALLAVVQAQFTYITSNNTITITTYTGSGGAVTIPSTINSLPVTANAREAFYDSDITSVTIPNSVTNIAEEAFEDCVLLTVTERMKTGQR